MIHRFGITLIFVGILLIGFGIMDSNPFNQFILILVGVKIIVITIIFRKSIKLTNKF